MKARLIKLALLLAALTLLGSCLVGPSEQPAAPLCPAETGLLLEIRDPLGTLELIGGSQTFEALAASNAVSPRMRIFQQNLVAKRSELRLLSAAVKRINIAVLWDDPRVVYPFELGPPVIALLDVGVLRRPVKFVLTAMSKGGKVYGVQIRDHLVFHAKGVSIAFVADQIAIGSSPRINALLEVYDGIRGGLLDAHPNWADLALWADPEADVTGYLFDGRLIRLKQDTLPDLPIRIPDLVDIEALDGAVLNAFIKDEGPLLRGTILQREGRSFLRLLDLSRGEPQAKYYLTDDVFSAMILRLSNPTQLAPLLSGLLRGQGIGRAASDAEDTSRAEAIRASLLDTAITAMLAQIDHELAVFTLEPGGPRVLFILLKEVEAAQTVVRVLGRASGVRDFTVPPDGEIGSVQIGQSQVNVLLRGRKVLLSGDAQALRRLDQDRNPQSLPESVGAAYEYVDPDGSLLLVWDLLRQLESQDKITGAGRELLRENWRGHFAAGFTVEPDRTEISAYLPLELMLGTPPGWWERQTMTWLHTLFFLLRAVGWTLACLLLWLTIRQLRAIRRLRAEKAER
ncbi:MAG: hypothetical protein P9M14_06935 [Candidatus Alcyoniella australis]|nr:hypothetical protein [Candidatus Alcyoniella australis]